MIDTIINEELVWKAPVIEELGVDLTSIAGTSGAICQSGTFKSNGTANGICS